MAFLTAGIALFVITIVASVLFYRRIRQAQEEYENSKEVTKNIVVSFSRELSRERRKSESVYTSFKESVDKSLEAIRLSEGNRLEIGNLSDRIEKNAQELVSVKNQMEKLTQQGGSKEDTVRNNQTQAPIPVSERGILSGLNETELMVLEILNREGEMSVPNMKEAIGKTREHTARIFKKLYDRGFVDRNTRSMPYNYRIRKELEDLLKEGKQVDLIQ